MKMKCGAKPKGGVCMYVREFMTRNVVTVSSDTTIVHAARLLYAHKIRRLPVVDGERLVGLIGDRMIAAVLPSAATTLSTREMADLLSRLTVGKFMNKHVITVTPETTAETALAVAQENGVGCLVVVDDEMRVVGIVTTKDFVTRILNPLLGKGKPGTRIHIYDCSSARRIAEVMTVIDRHNLEIVALHLDDSSESNAKDLIVQLNKYEADPVIRDLKDGGFSVEVRERRFWPTA